MRLRECKLSLRPGEEVQNETAVLGKEGQGVEVVPRDQVEPVLQGPDKGGAITFIGGVGGSFMMPKCHFFLTTSLSL